MHLCLKLDIEFRCDIETLKSFVLNIIQLQNGSVSRMAFPHLTEHSRLSSESKMQLAREGVAAAATASKIINTDLIMLNTVV